VTRLATALLLLGLTLSPVSSPDAAATPYAGPTPGVGCAPGALPEAMQGRAPASDVVTGGTARGYRCNAVEIGHTGNTAGYRVERYVDRAGHECAFSDSTAFFAEQVPDSGPTSTGVYVFDLHDPRHPVQTDTLRTPAMQSPHESLRLNAKRGLLAAAASTVSTGPGIVDVYDVKGDCRHPALLSSTPLGVLGHESAFSPDGLTFYVTSVNLHSLVAVDLTDPTLPTVPWFTLEYGAHGASVSLDGTRLYVADVANNGFNGLTILDVSQVQARIPFPTVPVLGRVTWPEVSIPQNATPFTQRGHDYVLEVDEFGERVTGAARIIDVEDARHPFVVSNLRLKVNQPEVYDELQSDPGNGETSRGYQAHYCSLPSRVDPNIVACSFLMSGLRVFDIRDVTAPRELAYFNRPMTAPDSLQHVGSCAMSAPAYDPASHDIWYSDVNSGLYVVRLVGRAAIPFAGTYLSPGS
jgi:hypothetical protein